MPPATANAFASWWKKNDRAIKTTPPTKTASFRKKACSSAESFAFGVAKSFDQSGLPVNNSASHHTSPASNAVTPQAGSAAPLSVSAYVDPATGVVILTGAGDRAFVAGAHGSRSDLAIVRATVELGAVEQLAPDEL